MKIYFIIIINFIFLIIFTGCEELEITYPGNNQDLDPKPPEGSLDWAIDYDEISGNGKLKGNWMPDSKYWVGFNYRANF